MAHRKEIWIDTNIIIYVLRTNKDYSAQSRQLVTEAAQGNLVLKVSPLVISECVIVLMGQQFRETRDTIKSLLISFINLKGVECEEKAVVEEALIQFAKQRIDFVDAYLAAHAKAVTPAHIVTMNVKDFLQLAVTVETPVQTLSQSTPPPLASSDRQ